MTLAAMLGQIGTPGGGFGFSYHYSNGGNPTRVGGVLPEMSAAIAGQASEAADDGGMTAIPVARIVDALENPRAANISITVKSKRIRISK